MDGLEDTEDDNLLNFTIKGIVAGNPEVVNAVLQTNFSLIAVNSQPSNEEIQINPELPSAGLGFDMAGVASNNQRVLNSSLSHGSQGYGNGELTSRISISDSKISNSSYDMSMQMNVPITFETMNSQAACLNQENSHGFDMSNGSTFHPVPNDIVKANTIHAPDRKICVSYIRVIADNIQSGQGAMNSVSAMDTSATTRETAFDNSRLTGKYDEFSNIKEPNSHNQGMQVLPNLSETIGEFAVSNNIFQSPQNETTNSEYSRESKEIRLVDDTLAFPGPSGIQQNKNASNFSGEIFQLGSPIKLHSFEKRMLIYKFCKNEITEPGVAYQEKYLYVCFVCKFKSEEKENIRSHINVYRFHHYYCYVCGEVYTEAGSHDCERKCEVCEKKFLCKGQLEQHSANHEDDFLYHCRLCKKKINEHVSRDSSKYNCCKCKTSGIYRSHLLRHLFKHSDLRISKCHICGMRFRYSDRLNNHLREKHLVEDLTIH